MADMSSTTRHGHASYADWLALGENVRAEWVDGEIFLTPSATPRHQDVASRVKEAIDLWACSRRAGRAFTAPLDVHLPGRGVVQPDVVYVSRERFAILTDAVRGLPDLVVEVLSPTHRARDLVAKRALYLEAGVGEYWIVDPEERTVLCLARARDSWSETRFEGDEVLRSDALPGFALALRDLFAPTP
jgi:Uma2 family endonuclease